MHHFFYARKALFTLLLVLLSACGAPGAKDPGFSEDLLADAVGQDTQTEVQPDSLEGDTKPNPDGSTPDTSDTITPDTSDTITLDTNTDTGGGCLSGIDTI